MCRSSPLMKNSLSKRFLIYHHPLILTYILLISSLTRKLVMQYLMTMNAPNASQLLGSRNSAEIVRNSSAQDVSIEDCNTIKDALKAVLLLIVSRSHDLR